MFLTYAAPAIKNTMLDLVHTEQMSFEHRMATAKAKDGVEGFGLELCTSTRFCPAMSGCCGSRRLPIRCAASGGGFHQKQKLCGELYAALDKLEPREQTYLLYRFGFTDDIEYTLTGAAIHFHLSENRTKLLEDRSLDTLRKEMP